MTDTMRLSADEWQAVLTALREFVRLANEEASVLDGIDEPAQASAMRDHAQKIRRLLRSVNRSQARRAPADDEWTDEDRNHAARLLGPDLSPRKNQPAPAAPARQQTSKRKDNPDMTTTVISEQITLDFVRDTETKNTVRFDEIHPDDAEPVVGKLYVRKTSLGDIVDTVDRLEITIKITGLLDSVEA